MNRPKLLIDWEGQQLTVEALAAHINISASSIRRGLRKGLSIDEIINSIDDRFRRWNKHPVDEYNDLEKAIVQGRYREQPYYWQER